MASPILEIQKQQLLLQTEYEEEKKAFQEKIDAIGLQRRIRQGDAWWPVHFVRSYYNSLNQYCVEIQRTGNADTEDIDHHFEYGRPVEFFRTQNLELRTERYDYTQGEINDSKTNHTSQFSPLTSHLKGTVSFVDADRMVICVPDSFNVSDLQQEGLGIQLSFDETSYRMMFDALDRTMRAKGRLGYLRDLFYTPAMKAETFSFADIHFPYLNATQEHAVNEVLRAKDVAIVHGPPGTGKPS